jgi:hypothetical protein
MHLVAVAHSVSSAAKGLELGIESAKIAQSFHKFTITSPLKSQDMSLSGLVA